MPSVRAAISEPDRAGAGCLAAHRRFLFGFRASGNAPRFAMSADVSIRRAQEAAAPRPTASAGFILPMTLWLVAILALIAVFIESWLGDDLDLGYGLRARVEAARQAEEAQATALYWLTTRYMSHRGLEIVSATDLAAAQGRDVFSAAVEGASYIALDDRPYRYRDSRIRLQDGRGLLDINHASPPLLRASLRALGAPAEVAEGMIARLRDYIDPTPFKSLNGAKARDYAAAARAAPRGAPLVTPWELSRVLDWDRLDSAGFGASPIYRDVGTVPVAGLNLNTAPPSILAALPGVDSAAVAGIIEARRKRPFDNLAQVEIVSGAPMPAALQQFLFLPADVVRIGIAGPEDGVEQITTVRLTPEAPDRPWQIGYTVNVPLLFDHRMHDPSDVVDFPDPAHLSPSPRRG